MTVKKTIYESDTLALPPLSLVLGNVPSPDPETRRRPAKNSQAQSVEMIAPVKRLIAHLKENKE